MKTLLKPNDLTISLFYNVYVYHGKSCMSLVFKFTKFTTFVISNLLWFNAINSNKNKILDKGSKEATSLTVTSLENWFVQFLA